MTRYFPWVRIPTGRLDALGMQVCPALYARLKHMRIPYLPGHPAMWLLIGGLSGLLGAAALEATSAERSGEQLEVSVPSGRFTTHQLVVEPGDSLLSLLQGGGTSTEEAYRIMDVLREHMNPNHLRIGQEMTLTMEHAPDHQRARKIRMLLEADKELVISRRSEGTYQGHLITLPLRTEAVHVRGQVTQSLYEDGRNAGIPHAILHQLIRHSSHALDLQRDIQPGDQFTVLYEQTMNEYGALVGYGDIVYASLRLSGNNHAFYRYLGPDDVVRYYDDEGISAKRKLLRTPVEGARLSSRFGLRHHPVQGYTKMHKGIDFAAPSGTPVYAAGKGRVERIGRGPGYGRYIRVYHNKRYSTLYAHLNGYANGLKEGDHLRQGQVIGYVGSTGRATGPHLHYEILRQNAHINPLTLKAAPAHRLRGALLADFQSQRREIQQMLTFIPFEENMAQVK